MILFDLFDPGQGHMIKPHKGAKVQCRAGFFEITSDSANPLWSSGFRVKLRAAQAGIVTVSIEAYLHNNDTPNTEHKAFVYCERTDVVGENRLIPRDYFFYPGSMQRYQSSFAIDLNMEFYVGILFHTPNLSYRLEVTEMLLTID